MPIFGLKLWVNPFGKVSNFGILKFLFLQPRKGFFSFQNIVKDIFLAYIAKIEKLEKRPFLDQNHGLTALEKCQFFNFLKFLFFQPTNAFFLVQNMVKDIFLAYIAQKEKLEKWPFIYQDHGLTPLEKSEFFDVWNYLFLQLRNAFFRSRIS